MIFHPIHVVTTSLMMIWICFHTAVPGSNIANTPMMTWIFLTAIVSLPIHARTIMMTWILRLLVATIPITFPTYMVIRTLAFMTCTAIVISVLICTMMTLTTQTTICKDRLLDTRYWGCNTPTLQYSCYFGYFTLTK